MFFCLLTRALEAEPVLAFFKNYSWSCFVRFVCLFSWCCWSLSDFQRTLACLYWVWSTLCSLLSDIYFCL